MDKDKKIPSKELRQGNYVQTQRGDILQCTEAGDGRTGFYVADRKLHPLKYEWQPEALPLTVERILILQFCHTIDFTRFEKYNGRKLFVIGRHNEIFTMYYANDIGMPLCELGDVESVHILQNVYFYLMGEEII